MDKKEKFYKYWAKTCLGKVRYNSTEQARQACVNHATRFKRTFSLYSCKICLGYHLTTKR